VTTAGPERGRVAAKAHNQAEIHRVLANPRRLLILWYLVRGERSVGELAQVIGASLQSTSQHLRLMREHGMVCARREGQTVYYQIAAEVNPEWLPRPVDQNRHSTRPNQEGDSRD
jgi:ArsR family transcriptional regulator, virulence genes transcriptional regulator